MFWKSHLINHHGFAPATQAAACGRSLIDGADMRREIDKGSVLSEHFFLREKMCVHAL